MSSVLNKEDIQQAFSTAKAKSAFEETRNASLKGWLFVILPITLVLAMILIYGVQEATGIQAYTLLAEPRNLQGQPLAGGQTGFKSILARMLLALIVVSAVIFLAKMWKKQGGATGFLVGGRIGRSAAFQTDLRALRDAQVDGVMANVALQEAQKAQTASIARQQADIAKQEAAVGAAGAHALNDVSNQYQQSAQLAQQNLSTFTQGAQAAAPAQMGFNGQPTPAQQGPLGYPATPQQSSLNRLTPQPL